MKATFALLFFVLPCLPARAGVSAVAVSIPKLAPQTTLDAVTIAKAIDLYNRENSTPKFLGAARLSVRLWVSSPDGQSVEAQKIPAILEQGGSVVIKHDALLMMDGGQARLLRSPARTISSARQLQEWAERARGSTAGDFDGALSRAAAAK